MCIGSLGLSHRRGHCGNSGNPFLVDREVPFERVHSSLGSARCQAMIAVGGEGWIRRPEQLIDPEPDRLYTGQVLDEGVALGLIFSAGSAACQQQRGGQRRESTAAQ